MGVRNITNTFALTHLPTPAGSSCNLLGTSAQSGRSHVPVCLNDNDRNVDGRGNAFSRQPKRCNLIALSHGITERSEQEQEQILANLATYLPPARVASERIAH